MAADGYDVGQGTVEALRMLALFESVGATAFDITHTNLAQEKRGFRPAQSVGQARNSIPHLVPSAARRQNNLIVRPRADGVKLIQLDDLPAAGLERIAPLAFLILQTSASGRQAWAAVKDAPPGFVSRLKTGLGADKEASGAVRVAGTQNFKAAYATAYPVVTIIQAAPGRIVTAADLAHLAAPEAPKPPMPPAVASPADARPRTAKWPSYAQCLERAPTGPSGSPRRTNADFVWCKIACSWGHSIEAVAARLMEESSKAQENGEAYARQTAEHADYAARQRNAQPRGAKSRPG